MFALFRPRPRHGNTLDSAKGERAPRLQGFIHSILIVVHWDCQIRKLTPPVVESTALPVISPSFIYVFRACEKAE